MAKLRLLADGWRMAQFDDQGRKLGSRRYRKGDEVEVDSSQVKRLLNVKRGNKHYFEEVKATESTENKPQASTPARPAEKKA